MTLSIDTAPAFDRNKQPGGLAECAAEIQARENNQWLKAIFDQSSVGFVEVDIASRKFLRFNQRFSDLLGYTREELMALSQPQVTYELDRELDSEQLERLQSGLIKEYVREKRYVCKDGSIVWVSVAVTRIGKGEGQTVTFFGVVQDITERKHLDEHFLQAQKMEALGQFSGGVAHDFNNILAAISGYTELSKMILKGNPEVLSHLDAILKSTGRAADLVRQILTFSRQEPQVRQAILLQPLIAESLKLMRATIPATVEIVMKVDADVPPILANANQIHQILMNLGINAWHAMTDKPGRITMTLTQSAVTAEYAANKPRLKAGRYVCLAVGDNGSGMSAETISRIFEPFYTTKVPGEGTGLGLAVVHGIMDSHDGTVTVTSEQGIGTIFSLYFPVYEGEVPILPVADSSTPLGNGERVLIVDDEEILSSMLQKTLTRLGYKADCALNPDQALTTIREDPLRYRVVISDQTMPVMTGLSLARELHQLQPKLEIILMTGYGVAITSERLEAAGVRQLMLKPVSVQALSHAVQAAVLGKPRTNNDSHSPYRG
jgi:PAS domain S-box-containing protein